MTYKNIYKLAHDKAKEESSNYKNLFLRQFLYDYLFGLYSQETFIKSKLKFNIMNLPRCLSISLGNSRVCIVKPNLTTEAYAKSQKVKIFCDFANPVFLLRIFFIMKFYLIININLTFKNHQKKYVNPYISPKKIFREFYVTYKIGKYLRKKNVTLEYFSNGVPQYLKFFTKFATEIQHGILHDFHPALNPILKSKSPMIVFDKYYNSSLKNVRIKVRIVSLKRAFFPTVFKSVYFEGLPGEAAIAVAKLKKCKLVVDQIVPHPNNRSTKQITVKKRDTILNSYQIVYSGNSSIICDINDSSRLSVVLTPFELERMGIHAHSPNKLEEARNHLFKIYGKNITNILFA